MFSFLSSFFRPSSGDALPANFYELSARTISGETVHMSQYKGKTLLIVNTASKCGLTPQFEGLEKLYQSYKDKGLVVLGFPCNQFAKQEPGSDAEVAEFCQVNYGVSFPMFSKIDVNGTEAHPIFKFLKKKLGGLFNNDIKWNFTKFVVDANGRPLKRFAPTSTPENMEDYIVTVLS
jgi:glutathione peroxidase